MKFDILKMFYKNRSGSTFVIVIGVLGIIIFSASMFMTSTIHEGKQTSMSIRGLHAASLAEASLERAIRILTEKVNKIDKNKDQVKADDLGILLRLPCKEGSSTFGQSENLGTDKELVLNDDIKKEIILTLSDLQPDGSEELEELVNYMTDNGVSSFSVVVKAKIIRAFRNSPGKDYPDYQIPGVDIGWNLRYDVKKFLNGEGYSAWEISLPSDMKWLDISIPIEFAGFTICEINVVSIIDAVLTAVPGWKSGIPLPGGPYTLGKILSFDFLADMVLNKLIARGEKKIYPIVMNLDKLGDYMKREVSDYWPSGVNVSVADGQYLEKYGQISLECEAKIEYKDHYTSARRVSAIKDFKVADCEPPAPMYSFFINNMQNDRIFFNNYGGQFYVNNYDYTGFFSKIKAMITGSSSSLGEDAETKEFPGNIRVNYLDESNKKPILCNVGIIGDWNGSTIDDDKGNEIGKAQKLLNGMEALMILAPKTSMAVAEGNFACQTEVKVKDTDSGKSVPLKLKDTYKKNKDYESPLANKSFRDFSSHTKLNKEVEKKGAKDILKKVTGLSADSCNMIPNIAKLSTNVIALAITLAVKPLGEAALNAALGDDSSLAAAVEFPDCFQKWEMPFMGTSNTIYTLPNTGTGVNKSHLFGYCGLHPTMSREIEGDVMKVYRQWKMCIVGMKPTDRLPLLPFPPVFIPPPPIVIPIWLSTQICEKYGFKLASLKSHDDNGDPDNTAMAYDPSKLENMAPNLYTNEQYAKKATYYYETYQDFLDDLPNRTTKLSNGKTALVLNGITYISDSLGSSANPFSAPDGDTLYVVGKGMIVCSGNTYLNCSIQAVDRSEKEHTVFSWICRKGALLIMKADKKIKFEGSLYTELGLYVHPKSSLHIIGNWVTNAFNKATMLGMVVVDYVSSRVRTSLGSLHPTKGKYDPNRYYVTFSPIWASWRAY